jgi:HD superfamily phosphodiesterase
MDFLAFQAVTIVCATAAFVASLRFLRQYLELRHARRIAAPPAQDDRLDRIEMIVEATAVEVERISEANRFMAKLLAERAGATPAPSSRPERVITPH